MVSEHDRDKARQFADIQCQGFDLSTQQLKGWET
jgi:hypothetical protein